MRFIHNLLPLLRVASTTTPHFSRTLSVLGAGHEGVVNLDDLGLDKSFSGAKCANHTIVMNDFMAEEFAAREPAISFIHSSPGVVNTGIARELPAWVRIPLKIATPLLLPFMVGASETGERQLFHATSGIYPPAKPAQGAPLAAGTPAPTGLEISEGADGKIGSGAYLVNWNGDITGKSKVLSEYREKGVAKLVWEHTIGVFGQVEKRNLERSSVGTS